VKETTMRTFRLFIVSVLVLAAVQALATSTWGPVSGTANGYSAIGTFTTGSEGKPTGSGDGAALSQSYALTIVVCAAAGETLTDGTSLDVYVYDDAVGEWAITEKILTVRIPTAPLSAQRCGSPAGDSPTLVGQPELLRRGRVAIVPNGIGASTLSALKPLTITIISTNAAGNPL
jgi:hypothetical protein